MSMTQPALEPCMEAYRSPNEMYQTGSYAFAVLYLIVGYFVAYLGFFRRRSGARTSSLRVWNSFCTTFIRPISKLISIYTFSLKDQLSNDRARGSTCDSLRWSAYTHLTIWDRIFSSVSYRRLWIPNQNKCLKGPPGLGNNDNSCYQNVILQAFASLSIFQELLVQLVLEKRYNISDSIVDELKDVISALNEPSNAGRRLWTPQKLKSMSSWQQQDAQEYYSKIMEQMEKELKYRHSCGSFKGIEQISNIFNQMKHGNKIELHENYWQLLSPFGANIGESSIDHASLRSPMNGLLAQRVGCSKCNYVEEISLIPFNCITVPLGNGSAYDLHDCLDEYTTLEVIDGVHCIRCTLLKERKRLRNIIDVQLRNVPTNDGFSNDPSSLSEQLSMIQNAIAQSEFADSDIFKRCRIKEERIVSSSKTRQAVIARLPRDLVIHINRSVFNEAYGIEQKNNAKVRLSLNLDLNPWVLGQSSNLSYANSCCETWSTDPSLSLLTNKGELKNKGAQYCLRAVISHFGRHENGHYICYRKYPREFNRNIDEFGEKGEDKSSHSSGWWRLSDDHSSVADEARVLNEGNAFMLFYETIGPYERRERERKK